MTDTTLRTIRLTSLQAALLFKADKDIKGQLTVVAKAPALKGEKPDWYKVQVTPEVAQRLMNIFTAMSKAKTSPIKMRLHQHAVCGAAARYIGDLLAGSATVAVLASKARNADTAGADVIAFIKARLPLTNEEVLAQINALLTPAVVEAPAAPVKKARKAPAKA